MSSNSASRLAVALCTMVSSGKIRLPLSHSHSLECVACFAGFRNWNELANSSSAIAAKNRARALRESINARLIGGLLSPLMAQEAIEQISDEWSVPGGSTRPSNQKTSALPITFFQHPIDDAWEADNPNALVDGEELDALISRMDTEDGRQKLEVLFAGYPGDIEVCHTLGSSLLDQGKISSALSVWRHAWSLIQPALDELLRKDPSAVVSYSSLRNRPILRAIHGLATCLGKCQDKGSVAEHEKLVRMGYSLMRYRDTFSFRTRLAQCLARRGEWREIEELMASNDSSTVNEQAITILALHHLGDKTRLAKEQRSLIDRNPFAAEVLMRGKKMGDYNGESVTLGTWQEGAEHMVLFSELWRADDSWKIWRTYRQRIKSAQTARLQSYWNTRSIGRNPDYLGALIEKLGGLHGRSMPLSNRDRPLVPSLIPVGCLSPLFAIELAEIQSFTIHTFEEWLLRGYGLHAKQRGLIFEWLVWRMVEEGVRQMVIKSSALYFDGRLACKISHQLQDHLQGMVAWELDGQLLDRPLAVRAPREERIFECRFSGQWDHEDTGIELSLVA